MSKMFATSRIQTELAKFNKDQIPTKMTLVPSGNDLSHLTASIPGPIESPYEGGTFIIDIEVPAKYPFEPPSMRFVTKVWHPNISNANGAICLDFFTNKWSASMNLKMVLLSLQALLSTPVPSDPQDAVVAKQYLNEYPTFLITARIWTETFASASSTGLEGKVQKLIGMGFTEDQVRAALDAAEGDENLAVEELCPIFMRCCR